jgi:hypothetical protein
MEVSLAAGAVHHRVTEGIRPSGSGVGVEVSVDLGVLVFRQAEGCGGYDALDLLRAAAPNDGCGDGGIVPGPGDRNNSGADSVTAADLFEQVGDGEIAGEIGLLIVLRISAKVIRGKGRNTLFRHGSGKQAGVHGGVVDDAYILLPAEGQNLRLIAPIDHGVGRLLRGDGCDLLDPLHLGDAEVGDADPADLALSLKVGHNGPAFLDVLVGGRPVDLVEIDGFAVQAAQAFFALTANLFLGAGDFALCVPDSGTLGEDIGLVWSALEGAGDDFFRVSEAIDCSSIDPVDPQVECLVNGCDGVVVVLRTPGKGPVASADCPGAKPNGREVEIGVP